MRSEGLVIGSALMCRGSYAPLVNLLVSSMVSLCLELVVSE